MRKDTFQELERVEASLTNLGTMDVVRLLLMELVRQTARLADSMEYLERREKGF